MRQRDLRAAVDRARRNARHKRPRYPKQLRDSVAEFVRAEIAGGRSMISIAQALDLPVNTVRRWSTTIGPRPRLAPVEVVTEAAGDRPVLVTPAGHRVEGLSMAALAVLLERLG